MKPSISLVIADDHPVLRKGLVHLMEGAGSITLAGEAADGETALHLIDTLNPDVAILDIEMPKMSGLEVAKAVQDRGLTTAIVILTMYGDEEMFNEAMDLGVAGYVLKENALSEVLNSVRAAAEGNYYISPLISGYLVNRSKKRQAAFDTFPSLASLTPTEWRVLKLVASNKTSKEIANDLCISPKTVENHRARIAEKLDLHGNNSLLRFALEHRSLF